MYGTVEAPLLSLSASAFGSLEHGEVLPAILKHLGHEWNTLETSPSIQGCQNFFSRANFHNLADSQTHSLRLFRTGLAGIAERKNRVRTPDAGLVLNFRGWKSVLQ